MLIASKEWIAPVDYKVYCYHGKATYILVCIGREKGGHPKFYFMDRNWELMIFGRDAKENPDISIPKPACFDKMMECAEKLSKPFPFVRVDFYSVGERLIFGELTFTPSGGVNTAHFPEADLEMGRLLDLECMEISLRNKDNS